MTYTENQAESHTQNQNQNQTQAQNQNQDPGAHYTYAPVPAAAVAAPLPTRTGPENSFAIASFVLGIASVVCSWTFIAPIVGLVLGVLALRRRTRERTLALWGVWLNGIMLAITALIVMALVAVAGLGIVVSLPYWGR